MIQDPPPQNGAAAWLGRGIETLLALLTIVAAVAVMIGVPLPEAMAPGTESPETEEAVEAMEDAVTISMLELQGRILVGASAFEEQTGSQEFRLDSGSELSELKKWANSARERCSLAALQFFIDPSDEGRALALELLEPVTAGAGEDRNAQPDAAAPEEAIEAEPAGEPESAPKDQGENGETLIATTRTAIVSPEELTESDRLYLEEQLGWFARVLTAASLPSDHPEKRAIRDQGALALVISGGLLIVWLLLGLVGAGLLLTAIILRSSGKFTMTARPDSRYSSVLLGAFAIYMAGMAAGLVVGYSIRNQAVAEWVSYLGLGLPFLAALLWVAVRTRFRPAGAFHQMGLHRGKGWIREGAAGVVGYVATVPIMALGIGAMLVLSYFLERTDVMAGDEPPPSHPIVVFMAHGDMADKLRMIALAVVAAPLLEEIMFRGALFGSLRPWVGGAIAALGSGFIFAVIHPQGWLGVPVLMAIGVSFAVIRAWRGSLIASMTAHAINNAGVMGMMLLVFGG